MKIKLFFSLFITSILLFFLPLGLWGAYEVLDTKYESFVVKLEKKYTSSQVISLLEKVSTSLDSFLARKDISEIKLGALRYLYSKNKEQINILKSQVSNSALTTQREKEAKYLILLKNSLKRDIPTYISTLSTNRTLYITNKNNEFLKDDSLYGIIFSQYFLITQENAEAFQTKRGIITSPEPGTFYFIENYKFEEKIPFSDLSDDNRWESLFIESGKRYFKEGSMYYGINFQKYNIFENKYGFYLSQLPKGDYIFVKDSESRFGYITEFSKIKLISEDIFESGDNRDNLLINIADDKKFIDTKTDELFNNLKTLTLKLVEGAKTDQEKIRRIYDWILNNIEYTRIVDLEDKKIFSGIDTYKNKTGVCEGYTKIMSYMLFFAGIQESEVVRGDVIDAQDFPFIGHAWIKLGDTYYDPTFDDPLGLTQALNYDSYRFFGLPKDLFYTNRYDYKDTPESVKKMSIDERKDIIEKNLSSLVEKYEGLNYLLLDPLGFRKKYNIQGDILQSDLEKILPKKILIPGKKYSYYDILESKDIEIILAQKKYNISDLFLVEGEVNKIFEIKK